MYGIPFLVYSAALLLGLTGCARGSVATDKNPAAPVAANAEPPPATAQASQSPATAPVAVSEQAPERKSTRTKHSAAEKEAATEPARKHVAGVEKPAAPKAVDEVWHLKKGKLTGQGEAQLVKLLSKSTDKKGQTTTRTCFKYNGFAIEETKVTGEVGSAEINLRRPKTGNENLCADDFAGEVVNVGTIEGYFAGRAGDYILLEGSDPADFILDFEVISLATGKTVYKDRHNPEEEFTISKRGTRTSLVYYAKLPVHCELTTEGSDCWKKILSESGVKKNIVMPDCPSAFKKRGVDLGETALVTARAEVANLAAPKLEFTGPKATCIPEP